VAEFGHGLGLDLADPLPGHPVHLADLIQRLGLPVGQPELQNEGTPEDPVINITRIKRKSVSESAGVEDAQ
jgi:hypothetical protein